METTATPDNSENVTRALIYGTISTFAVSLLSLAGACIIPLVKGNARHRWMHFFVAMAVSTLSSDALLHLIPQIMGMHDHGSHDGGHGHSHHHEEGEEHENHTQGHDEHEHHRTRRHADHDEVTMWTLTDERMTLLRLSVIMLAIYVLYLIEFILYYRKRQRPQCQQPAKVSPSTSRITQCEETVSNHAWEEQHSCDDTDEAYQPQSSRSEAEVDNGAPIVCCGLKSRALVILLGDAVHNLVDGVAIGVSFLVSANVGLVTTIAVICHELPHELGDLAVLLDSGLSMPKALFLNLLSALTAFIGLYASIMIGHNESAERWLLALTAGMFLYVAWIDMLAHLKHDGVHRDHWVVACLLQYAGFTVGFFVIFALGWFEHQLFEA